jgi:hypothetical protein
LNGIFPILGAEIILTGAFFQPIYFTKKENKPRKYNDLTKATKLVNIKARARLANHGGQLHSKT